MFYNEDRTELALIGAQPGFAVKYMKCNRNMFSHKPCIESCLDVDLQGGTRLHCGHRSCEKIVAVTLIVIKKYN